MSVCPHHRVEGEMTARDIVKNLRRAAEVLVSLALAALFGTFLIQIVFRYVLNLPLGWTVEFVAIAWLWVVLFGYAFVVAERDVIRLDIVYAILPPRGQRVLDLLVNLICAAIFLGTLPRVWNYVTFMSIEKTVYMKLPFDWVFSIYIPFALSVVVRCLFNCWRALRGTSAPPHTPAEVAQAHDYD